MGGGGGFLGLGGGGGGGGGGTTINYPQPQPIDYDKMAAASIRVAQNQIREEEAAIKRLYPEYIRMQMGTADQLSRNLDNEYLQRSRGIIGDEMVAASAPSVIESEIQRMAQSDLMRGPSRADRQIQRAGMGAMNVRADQVSGPQNIREISTENVDAGQLGDALMAQAVERAQSGGRLSAEASRDAVQSARAGMAARGLATGNSGLAAELLNRDRYSRARMAEDNAFAQSVQGQDLQRQFQNQDAQMRSAMANQQRDQVLGDMAMRAQMANQATNQNQLAQNRAFMLDANNAFLGAEDRRRAQALNANQMDLARRQRRIGLGGMYLETDPYRQALGPAFGLGGDTLRTSQGQVSNIFGNALTQSGNVASFNTNMQASMYNSAMNNNAAIQAANMQSRAMGNSGMLGMAGGIGGGLLMGAGLAI